jgi:16S rRNA (uracil1498-N3)-methyltransferase
VPGRADPTEGATGAELRRRAAAHVLVDSAQQLGGDEIHLGSEVEHHLRRVLRLRVGEVVTVTAGAGGWRPTAVRLRGTSLELQPSGDVALEPRPPAVTIVVAIPKGERLDWMVQKLTELGVDHLVLMETDRSAVRWKPDRLDQQLERLRRIAAEACRQSRRVWAMEVSSPRPAAEVLPGAALAEPGGRALRGSDRMVAVGPEGGWSEAELAMAGELIDLGPTVLRTETAAIALATLCVVRRH